jgi:transposase InsO family protein
VWTVTKLHKYIFGRRFTLITDHRPLLSIFGSKKGIPAHVANRIQRWAITLSAYDFEIKFTKTEDFGHADVLSRLIAEQKSEHDDLVIAEVTINRLFVQQVDATLPVTFAEIVEATEEDQVLPSVIQYVSSGWPSQAAITKSLLPLAAFFKCRESLSLVDGALTYMDRIVIPPLLQHRILKQLHTAHPGMTRMKALARCYVYWPGIDTDIVRLVRSCGQCQSAAKMPVKTDLVSWPTPRAPWERVHIDFAGPVSGSMFLILVDAFSKWPEVYRMSSTTTEATIKVLFEVISRFGNMKTLVSDNGPQFTSQLFASFCGGEDINHIRTAPYHPQSNGQCERFVDTFKTAIKKESDSSDRSIQQFLRTYRATPNPSAPDGQSPAELMFGRRLRLPLDAVRPSEECQGNRNCKMEEQFNRRNGTSKRAFQAKEDVLYRLSTAHSWAKAVVVETIGKVMYNILADDGRLLRVHTNQLRKVFPVDDSVFDPPVAVVSNERERRNPRAVTRSSPPVLRSRTRGKQN